MKLTYQWLLAVLWKGARKKRVWAGLTIISLLLVCISQVPFIDLIAQAHSWLADQGIWALPIFIAIYVMAAILGLPNIVLVLAAGTLLV
ncbi:MAG: hypothetical protein HC800_03445 [Phormidesmis sp. RL_2_1]|nr:hypothetical protein [Phormidesmis sp. RL_2_1]